MKQMPQIQNLRNVLILRAPNSLSDAIVSSCCCRELKKANSRITLTVACFAVPYDYFLHNPYVNEVVLLPKDKTALWWKALQLRQKKFDLILDSSSRDDSTWRIFKALLGKSVLLDRTTSPLQPLGAPDKHGTEHEQAILKQLGIFYASSSYDLPIPATTRQTVDKWLQSQDLNSYVLLNPAGTAKERQFRNKTLHEIAMACKKWERPFVIPVMPSSATRWQGVFADIEQAHVKVIDNIFELFELIRRASFIVTPDTAAVFVAAAFEKPTLIFYNHLTPYNAPDNPHATVIETDSADINHFNWWKLTALVTQLKSSL